MARQVDSDRMAEIVDERAGTGFGQAVIFLPMIRVMTRRSHH
ncbi:hypothetical protein ABZY68_36595 [Streptomyces sp. NPDC006482]